MLIVSASEIHKLGEASESWGRFIKNIGFWAHSSRSCVVVSGEEALKQTACLIIALGEPDAQSPQTTL